MKTKIYCGSHKKDGMVDVKTKRCQENGCNKLSAFNLPGEKGRKYCVLHKKEGMIDKMHKLCYEIGCEK